MSTIKARVVQPPSGSLTLKTEDAARVTILSTGEVGIGTITPTAELHVVGNTIVDGVLTGGINFAGGVTATGLISSTFTPTNASDLCNKTYVDGRVPVGPTIYSINNVSGSTSTALKTGSLSLTLPAGIWVCECYGMMFVDPFYVYTVSIGGVVVMTTTTAGNQQGASYAPIAGIRKITLTLPTVITFTATPINAGSYDVIFYCKATKVAS